MKILVVDDENVSRLVLERTLRGWGHDVVPAADGEQAWEILRAADPPPMAILDWMMPGLEGPDVCRLVRALQQPLQPYLILLTSRGMTNDVVVGLDSGADDYVTKPFDRAELRSRLTVGERVIGLQQVLAARVKELEQTLARVDRLQGLLPICAWCKHVRNDGNYWQSVEEYLAESSHLRFTHGICPSCLARESARQVE